MMNIQSVLSFKGNGIQKKQAPAPQQPASNSLTGPAKDTVAFSGLFSSKPALKGIAYLEKHVFNQSLADEAPLETALYSKYVEKTEENINALAKHYQERKAKGDTNACISLKEVIEDFWGIDITKVKPKAS